jgi:hypothetical protein
MARTDESKDEETLILNEVRSTYGVFVPVSVLAVHRVDCADNLPDEVLDTYENRGQCLCCGCHFFNRPPAREDGDTFGFLGDHDCRDHAWPRWRTLRARYNCKKVGAKALLVLRAVTALREDLLKKSIEAKFAPGGRGARDAEKHFGDAAKRQRCE